MSRNNGVSKALAVVMGICASIPQVGAAKRGNGVRMRPGGVRATGNMKRGANQLKVNQVQVGQNMPSKAKGGFWIGPNGKLTKGAFAVGGTGIGVLVINGVIFLPRFINGKWIWQKSKKGMPIQKEEDLYEITDINVKKGIQGNDENDKKDNNEDEETVKHGEGERVTEEDNKLKGEQQKKEEEIKKKEEEIKKDKEKGKDDEDDDDSSSESNKSGDK